MYAIVEIAGKQYKIEKDAVINVDRLKKADSNITLDKVLLYSNDSDVRIGKPYLNNVQIKAEILGEVKGNKVFGVKFKKRKNYTRTIGHRTVFSQIKISDVTAN